MWIHLFLLLAALYPAAAADDPEYLLSDHGVRLELPRSKWHMSKWATDAFEGKLEAEPVLIYAWATRVRAPVDNPEAWAPVYVAKAEDLQGTDLRVTGSSVEEVSGHPWALVDVAFALSSAGGIALRGATTELAGKNFHVAVVAPARLAKLADRERAQIIRELEFTAEVPPAELGGTVSTDRLTTKLPDGWRALEAGELDAVTSQLVKLGLEDLTGCWTAIRGHPGNQPDVMVTCSKPLHLGVVDEHSFDEHERTAREKLFGPSVPIGTAAAMPDRTGMVFTPRDGLAMGVAPDSDHVAVIWALGQGDVAGPVRAALGATTFASPHATGPGDQLGYWVKHRPTSPAVLCPAGCLCGAGALVVGAVALVVGLRSRRRGGDEDDG
ncbi:MAG: hypothetical protein ABMB14_10440 [Myxococcota bacterium]